MSPQVTLSESPERLVAQFLVDNWNPSNTVGFDPTVTNASSSAFMPIVTSQDEVGEIYPSITITFSNETTAGPSTYDFLTDDGPGQVRDGSLLSTAQAEDTAHIDAQSGYTGEPGTYNRVTAETLVDVLNNEVERITLENATPNNELMYIGSQPSADIPDDTDQDPTVRQSQIEIRYSWLRSP